MVPACELPTVVPACELPTVVPACELRCPPSSGTACERVRRRPPRWAARLRLRQSVRLPLTSAFGPGAEPSAWSPRSPGGRLGEGAVRDTGVAAAAGGGLSCVFLRPGGPVPAAARAGP